MAFYDTVHIAYLHDDKNTVWRAILAAGSVARNTDTDIHPDNMACRKNIQNRNPYVRQETRHERNMEVAEILIDNEQLTIIVETRQSHH